MLQCLSVVFGSLIVVRRPTVYRASVKTRSHTMDNSVFEQLRRLLELKTERHALVSEIERKKGKNNMVDLGSIIVRRLLRRQRIFDHGRRKVRWQWRIESSIKLEIYRPPMPRANITYTYQS